MAQKLPAAALADVRALAELMTNPQLPSPFFYEGVAVAALRARRCLAGWRYDRAHEIARRIVKQALDRVNARRPSWEQGQDWYASGLGGLLARERQPHCLTCGALLSDARSEGRRWCSQKCARIGWNANESAGEFLCAGCGVTFRRQWLPSRPKPAFCSRECQSVHQHADRHRALREAIAASTGESIRATARRLGCSRVTVRAWRAVA